MNVESTRHERRMNRLNMLGFAWFILMAITVALFVGLIIHPQSGILRTLTIISGLSVLGFAVILLAGFAIAFGLEESERESSGILIRAPRWEEAPKWMRWLAVVLLSTLASLGRAMALQPRGAAYVLLVITIASAGSILILIFFQYVLPALVSRIASPERSQRIYAKLCSAGDITGFIVIWVWLFWLAKNHKPIIKTSSPTEAVMHAAIFIVAVVVIALLFTAGTNLARAYGRNRLSR